MGAGQLVGGIVEERPGLALERRQLRPDGRTSETIALYWGCRVTEIHLEVARW